MGVLVSGWNLLNGMVHVESNLFDRLVGTHWKKLLLIGVVVLSISQVCGGGCLDGWMDL